MSRLDVHGLVFHRKRNSFLKLNCNMMDVIMISAGDNKITSYQKFGMLL